MRPTPERGGTAKSIDKTGDLAGTLLAMDRSGPALLETELPRAKGRPAMRSATTRNATVLSILASAALAVGCSHDASSGGGTPPLVADSSTTLPASLTTSDASALPAALPEPMPVSVDPATAKAAWTDGVTLFDGGDYAAASEKLKTAVAGEPQSAYRHYLLGLSLWKSGDPAGAETALVESARLDATRVKTFVNLARVRNERDDRSGALEAADKGLELDSTSADALHQKGRALMALDRGDEALVALSGARDLDNGNGYIANTLGLLLIQLGRPAEAVEPLEAAKSVLPQVPYVRNNLGVAYERTERLDEAKIEYLAAVQAGDTSGKASSSLARLGVADAAEPVVDIATATAKEPVE
jgi:Flp pilus assembly protein TadD